MNFEFATATRILFGPGTLRQAAPLAAGLGRRALVVTGRSPGRAAPLLDALRTEGVAASAFPVAGEPEIDTVQRGLAQARAEASDLVIALGGGSALDTGKAIAALLANGGEPLDYLEVIGRGQPLAQPSLPFIAIPTTAGTGAEVTRNAVLASPAHGVKASLRSPHMLPRLAIVDPELTHSAPPEVTASSGLDALTQLVEPFVCSTPNPITDALCREGMRHAGYSLRRAYHDGQDAEARQSMCIASLFGGLALANARLGAVHALAGPLGGLFPMPHGAICARLLPFVMEANLRAVHQRAPASPALARYDEAARILTGRPEAVAADGLAWVRDLCAALQVRPLSAFGLREPDLAAVAAQAQRGNSMKGNPISLDKDELIDVLQQAQ
jgi:alcohol dehydrogenase class IV